MLRNQKGFTLMELMIVIVIIGVLAAIGVPSYKNYVNKAKEGTCQANRRSLQTAVGLYYAENTSYPGSVDALSAYIDNAADLKCPSSGTYSIDSVTGEIYCDVHHPAPTP